MAYHCLRCGKELNRGALSCTDCSKRQEPGASGRRPGTRKKKVRWFLVGLLIILAIGGVLHMVEEASMPGELVMQIEAVRFFRRLPTDLQLVMARERGKTVEELLTMPYSYWSPKVLVGLLSAWGGAWAMYLTYSFFRLVDREEPG